MASHVQKAEASLPYIIEGLFGRWRDMAYVINDNGEYWLVLRHAMEARRKTAVYRR